MLIKEKKVAIAETVVERTCSLREMMSRVDNEEKPRFVYSVIKEGSVGIIYGPAKSGKTIFCENLGLAIVAERKEYLTKRIDIQNRKVLFISLEEFYQNRTERNKVQLAQLSNDEVKLAINNFIVVNENMPKQFVTREDWAILNEEIEKHKPGIVFIDSLTRIIDGQIENSDVAKKAMLHLREIAEKNKVTLVMIHHSVKIDFEQPLGLNNMAGSRVIAQECDFIFGLNKTFSNRRYLKLIAARYANDNYPRVTLYEIDNYCWLKLMGVEYEKTLLQSKYDGRKDDGNQNLILDFIKEKLGDQEFETKVLSEEFEDKVMSRPTLHSALGKLVSNELLIKVKHGVYKLAV